jgi:hypothetical protein
VDVKAVIFDYFGTLTVSASAATRRAGHGRRGDMRAGTVLGVGVLETG